MTEHQDQNACQRAETKQAWTAPRLRRLEARGAETNSSTGPDADIQTS
jgi:hypothetical protein